MAALPATYTHPASWPEPGCGLPDADLAAIAVGWIAMNQDYIAARFRPDSGVDFRDVISLLMYRAHLGKGLAAVLAKHSAGVAPIREPQALLLRYVDWAAGEHRRQRGIGEIPIDPTTGALRALTSEQITSAPEDNPTGHLLLIDMLAEQVETALQQQAVHALGETIPELWKIFCRFAPAPVIAEVSHWDDEHRACMLLGVFPLRLPHRAIAVYRRLAGPAKVTGVSLEATQKFIRRIREDIEEVWPPELLPSRFSDATRKGGTRRDDHTGL